MSGLLTLPRFADQRIVVPTVTGGCAADPTCDEYDIYGDGVMAQVVGGASSNILPESSRSFEDASTGAWFPHVSSCTIAASQDFAVHGSYGLKITDIGGPAAGVLFNSTGYTAAGGTYTFSGFVLGTAGHAGRILFYDNISSWQVYNFTFTGDTQLVTATFTYGGGSTTRHVYLYNDTISGGASWYADALSLTNTAYPVWFANGDRTDMTQTVPTASLPLYAGGPFTIIIYCGPSPWAGNDGRAYAFFSIGDYASNNSINIRKSTSNVLSLIVYDNAGTYLQKYDGVNATNWPIGGYHAIMARRTTIAGVANMSLFLDRTELTSSNGAGTLESSLGATTYLGQSHTPDKHINMPALYDFQNRAITDDEWDAICDELEVA